MEQGDVDEFPGITAQGYSNLGNNNGPYYSSNQLNYNFSGSILRVIGKHTADRGGGAPGLFPGLSSDQSFADELRQRHDAGPDPLAVSSTAGDGVASMLLGTGTSGSAGYYAQPGQRQSLFRRVYPGRYQVDAQAHHQCRIPAGAGDRHDERYNRMAAIDPTVLNPISNQVTNPFTGQTPWNLYGGYVFAGNGPDSLGRRAIRGIEIKPSPRIGIAYSLNDKTVIRTGYGFFYRCSLRRRDARIHQLRIPDLHTVGEHAGPHPSEHAVQQSVSVGICLSAGQFAGPAFRDRAEFVQRAAFDSAKRSTTSNGTSPSSAASRPTCCCRWLTSETRELIWPGPAAAVQRE